jgi:hypothetical protein
VFFDTLGIKWQYEPQGYVITTPDGPVPYLPDFWLEVAGIWAEIKGDPRRANPVLLGHASAQLPGGLGLMLLGEIPLVHPGWVAWHHLIQYGCAHVSAAGPEKCSSQPEWRRAGHYWQNMFQFTDRPRPGIGLVEHHGLDLGSVPGPMGSPSFWQFTASVFPFGTDSSFANTPLAVKAYQAARSARFEHGQSGGPG